MGRCGGREIQGRTWQPRIIMQRDIDTIYLNPCCIHKHLGEYLSRKEPTCFFGNSDWDLPHFLEVLSLYVPSGELTVCLPKISLPVAGKLSKMLCTLKFIKKLNVIYSSIEADEKQVLLSGNPEAIAVAKYPIGFRLIAIRNNERQAVISGSFNQQKMEVGMQLQQFTLCTDLQSYEDVMSALAPVIKFHKQ